MQTLFSPAIALMNRMTYPRKFALMGLMALVAIAVVVYSLFVSLDQVIRSSQKELAGIEAMKPMARLVQNLQQHRGLSSGVLNGNETMKDKRLAKERDVVEAFRAVEGKVPSEQVAGEAWKKLLAGWEDLRKEGLGLTATENFASHTRLIDDVLIFQAALADEYALTNDPEIDSMYLIDTATIKLPVALERLGQLRARGTGILTKKQIVQQQQVDMSSLLAELNSSVKALRLNLDKTARYNPAMKGALDGAARELVESAAQVSKLVVEDIFPGAFQTLPADYFALTTAAIDRGYQQMYETLLPTAEALIKARIAKAERELRVDLGVTILCLLVVAYFAMGVYYATINSIKTLAANTHTLAAGDLRVRIDLGTRDELKLVGDSFNDMANAFSALLRKVKQSAEQVLDAARHMSASTEQISASTEQQSQAASAMAAAVEQMTVGVDHISKNAQDADLISKRAGALSAEGSRIVATVVGEIGKIAESVTQSSTIITDLGAQSERISAIVNVIKEIADQTNLLALNAAIEAARAGESGRGFAVVADEVRKLAERTAKSTQEISAMIGAIQSGTQSAVLSMRDGVGRVNEGVTLSTRAGEAMRDIQESASQVVSTVGDISSSLREQSTASSEIARNVERIAQMAEENTSAVAENASTAARLESLSEALDAEIQHFRLG